MAAAAACALAWSSGAWAEEDHPKPDEPPPPSAKQCVKVTAEAQYRDYAYTHIVHVDNGCSKRVTCRVSTNVNPDVKVVTVEAGETKDVTTFRGSPAREFTPDVECKLPGEK